MGLKGRYNENKIEDDHLLNNDGFLVPDLQNGKVIMSEISALTAINERLRNDYRDDCQKGVDRWNRIIEKANVDFKLTLPHIAFNRNIGTFQDSNFDLEGNLISAEEFAANKDTWMPNSKDREFVNSLMQRVVEPGKMAGWIAPPSRGIQGQDVEYEYVILH